MKAWAQPRRVVDDTPLERADYSRSMAIEVTSKIKPIDLGYLVTDAIKRGQRLAKVKEMVVHVHIE